MKNTSSHTSDALESFKVRNAQHLQSGIQSFEDYLNLSHEEKIQLLKQEMESINPEEAKTLTPEEIEKIIAEQTRHYESIVANQKERANTINEIAESALRMRGFVSYSEKQFKEAIQKTINQQYLMADADDFELFRNNNLDNAIKNIEAEFQKLSPKIQEAMQKYKDNNAIATIKEFKNRITKNSTKEEIIKIIESLLGQAAAEAYKKDLENEEKTYYDNQIKH